MVISLHFDLHIEVTNVVEFDDVVDSIDLVLLVS